MERKKTKRQIAAFSNVVQNHMDTERKRKGGALLSDVILGGQDGLVNVLGIVLGVASATSDRYMVLVAGLVAAFAESVSMAAVAYSSVRAEQDHYERELKQEEWEMEHLPDVEEEEVRLIYMRKGYRGRELKRMVKGTVSNKEMWLSVMMADELGLAPVEGGKPFRAAAVVGLSAIVGSLIPLLPFLALGIGESIIASLALSTLVLFGAGVYKARVTVGDWLKSGIEMAGVGMLAALVGYFVGKLLGGVFGLDNVPSG